MLTPPSTGRVLCTGLWLKLCARFSVIALCCLFVSLAPIGSASAQESPDELELESELEPPPTPSDAIKTPTADAQGSPERKQDGATPDGASSASKGQVKVEKLPAKLQAQPSRGEELYKQQIAQIEAQVNELKEEVFRSRTRLDILKETVLAIGLSGSEVTIIHRNEMGANFKLESVYYMIDDTDYSISKKTHPDFDTREEIVIYDGPLSSENHTIQVELVYRGNGFGVFSYLQSYLFTLNNVHTFKAEEGKRTIIKGIGYEKGGTLEFTERPALRFDQSEVDLEQKKRPNGE